MGTISSINFACQGEMLSEVSWSHQVSPEKLSCYNMPENWPIRSDYNSKWVIGA